MSLEVIILAAGKGKRMHSKLPKVLHKVANKPMLEHVIDTAASLNPESIHVVVGHMAELVEQMVNGLSDDLNKLVKIDLQKEQLGTGHAVSCAMGDIKDESDVLVLYGDTPLTPAPLLQDLIASLHGREMSVLTALLIILLATAELSEMSKEIFRKSLKKKMLLMKSARLKKLIPA